MAVTLRPVRGSVSAVAETDPRLLGHQRELDHALGVTGAHDPHHHGPGLVGVEITAHDPEVGDLPARGQRPGQPGGERLGAAEVLREGLVVEGPRPPQRREVGDRWAIGVSENNVSVITHRVRKTLEAMHAKEQNR